MLKKMPDADQLVTQLAADFRQADLTPADRAMLEYAAKLTIEPWHMVEADVIALRNAGFEDAAILDINQVTGYYAFANRLVDGLGVELEPIWDEQDTAD
ncbi:MAG: peroxidase [Caldilineaceae bacterium]|nr:peroxidase [Caldilineaceae bacterium]